MPQEKGFELAFPPQDLWMAAVAFLALGQYGPDGMELTVFAQQMVAAQLLRGKVPNSHIFRSGSWIGPLFIPTGKSAAEGRVLHQAAVVKNNASADTGLFTEPELLSERRERGL